ncbi:hypothetical protein HL658_36150 [Azospirillum sp. RWY-5-1]|uniref:Uncharacterized protein n=1 Tax=Azospirillum oleiclasticum TaxID=2735135 RepID=A0ABX2TJR3_9PROT|nr:hypothetical protein [Azospirillum oleiclasticum]NYZ18001.1 hypothetical protein [Azospirillum oleiclasticum]NYZ23407.1 hypothetical protein [Azospirillum oleiclasticum]
MTTPLFDDREIAKAAARLSAAGRRRITKVFRFRNALHAFLRDVERAQWEDPPIKILAVDTSEIVAAITYPRPNFTAFTFNGLLIGNPEVKGDHSRGESNLISESELQTLDRLILQHLLEGRRDRFLLLDDHADEVAIIRNAILRQQRVDEEALRGLLSEKFKDFRIDNLERIRSWLLGNRDGALKNEWKKFREGFLPLWREGMLDALQEATRSLRTIDNFIRDGHYTFVRSSEAGVRSLITGLKDLHGIKFDWSAYENFAHRDDVQKIHGEICDVVERMAASMPRQARSRQMIDQAARRDAYAFAQIHLLNCFFHEQQINARVELVSRSSTLHDIIAALPEGRLHVTLRHPLLMPDIYRFEPDALAAIGDVLQRVESLIRPYMDDIDIDPVQSDTAAGDGERDEEEAHLLHQAALAARQAIPLLRDVLTVQQGREQSEGTFTTIFHKTFRDDPARGHVAHAVADGGEDAVLRETIRDIFDILARNLRDRDDPFSASTIRDLVSRNKDLIAFERKRTFSDDATFAVRLLDFHVDAERCAQAQSATADRPSTVKAGFCGPIPEMRYAVRPVDPAFGRLFHLYSNTIADFLAERSREITAGDFDHTGFTPTEIKLSVGLVLDKLDESIDHLSQPTDGTGTADAVVRHLGATLLACLAFASRRKFETAINIASTILHHVTSQMRRGELNYNPGNLRRYLAYRELFLFRHYCERCIAMDEFFSRRRSFNDSKGGVIKNFARAQRDLDFAALMAEAAERCMADPAGDYKLAPAGLKHFNDFRLRLAHMSSWIDQFLILITTEKQALPENDWKKLELESVRRRLDIWTAAGHVKEAVGDAYRARELSEEPGGGDVSGGHPIVRRYLAHIEARSLQNALTIFLLFITFRIAPEMHRLWNRSRIPSPERILVFRDWKDWWCRYKDLRHTYTFSMRIAELIDRSLECLTTIESIRADQRPDSEKRADHRAALEAFLRATAQISSGGGEEATFIRVLSTEIRSRVEELARLDPGDKTPAG